MVISTSGFHNDFKTILQKLKPSSWERIISNSFIHFFFIYIALINKQSRHSKASEALLLEKSKIVLSIDADVLFFFFPPHLKKQCRAEENLTGMVTCSTSLQVLESFPESERQENEL